MLFRIYTVILSCLVLSACVTGSTDTLLSAEPVGSAQKAGNFPKIGRVPVAETSQLTPTEKTAVKTELNRDVQLGRTQAAEDSQAVYEAEVKKLRDDALKRQQTVLDQIEANERLPQE